MHRTSSPLVTAACRSAESWSTLTNVGVADVNVTAPCRITAEQLCSSCAPGFIWTIRAALSWVRSSWYISCTRRSMCLYRDSISRSVFDISTAHRGLELRFIAHKTRLPHDLLQCPHRSGQKLLGTCLTALTASNIQSKNFIKSGWP